MENTPQPKKINWGMIILLLVLIPVILLSYQYISRKIDGKSVNTVPINSNNTSSENSVFPLTGDWYYKDTGADMKYIYDKYSFGSPQMSNGTQKGQVTMTMDWMDSKKTLDYELVGNGKIKFIEPGNNQSSYEINYVYNAANQTLEISDQGHQLTYTRHVTSINMPSNSSNNSSSNMSVNNSSSGSNASSSAVNNQLKVEVDKFTRGKWQKYDPNIDKLSVVTFGTPRLENGLYVGESVMEVTQPGYCKLKEIRKYYIMPGGKYKTEVISGTCDGNIDSSQAGKVTEMFYEFYTDNNGNSAYIVWQNSNDKATATPYILR